MACRKCGCACKKKCDCKLGGCNSCGGQYKGGQYNQRTQNQELNPWVSFLKKWAHKNGMSYGDALRDPEASHKYFSKHRGVLKSPKSKRRVKDEDFKTNKKPRFIREYY